MSDNLNEKFEELVTEGDVGATALSPAIVPSQASGSQYMQPVTGQSVTAVNSKAGKQDSGFKVPTSVAPGQSEEDDGGSSFQKPQGESNPGAKSSNHNKRVSDAQTRGTHQDPMPTLKSSGYGLESGPNNTKVFGMEALDYTGADDVAALTEGEDLSEEFKTKARTIFEAAVKSRIEEQVVKVASKLQEAFDAKLNEEIATLSEKVDETLSYAIMAWVEENQIALDAGLRLEIAEEFMGSLKKVFEENYIDLPAEKIDAVESMTEELCEMEGRLNEQLERNIELNNRLAGYQKQAILSHMSEGLVDTQRDKLASLAENVEFVSEEDFKNKVSTIISSYFPKHVVKEQMDTAVEGVSDEHSPAMAAYLQALARWQ